VLLDAASCDPLYRKATRVAVAATLRVPWARLEPLAPARLEAHGFATLALTPDRAAPTIDQIDLPPRLALLLGTEGAGLRAHTLLAAGMRVRIPMQPGADSLNVATACAIALYVTRRAKM
jgi:tRNA G18 (ribose-2'-O)-methylase SpoU